MGSRSCLDSGRLKSLHRHSHFADGNLEMFVFISIAVYKSSQHGLLWSSSAVMANKAELITANGVRRNSGWETKQIRKPKTSAVLNYLQMLHNFVIIVDLGRAWRAITLSGFLNLWACSDGTHYLLRMMIIINIFTNIFLKKRAQHERAYKNLQTKERAHERGPTLDHWDVFTPALCAPQNITF